MVKEIEAVLVFWVLAPSSQVRIGWLLVATELNMETLVAQDPSAGGIWLGRPFNFLLDPQSCAHSHQLLTGHMPQQRRKSIQQWRRQRESQQ